MGRIDPKFAAEVGLRMVCRQPGDVVSALDPGIERTADAILEGRFAECPCLAGHGNLVERHRFGRRTGPVIVKIAVHPIVDVRELVARQRKEDEGRTIGRGICAAVKARHRGGRKLL